MGRMTVPAAPVAAQANACLLELSVKRLERLFPNDPDLLRAEPRPEVVRGLHDERLAAIEVFARACAAYADRPALGERAWRAEAGPGGRVRRPLPEFRTLSYRELWQRTVDLAGGLVRDPRTALRPGEVVAIHGFAGPDYVLADLACLYAGLPSAVLPATLEGEDLRHIADEARFACVICALESWPAVLAALPGCPTVRSVVVMDLRGDDDREAALLAEARERSPRPLATVDELAACARAGAALEPFLPRPGDDPLASLMYTSGSTGFPKGAMLPQSIWRSHWSLATLAQLARFPHINLNYLPLSHAMGRLAVVRALLLGGVTHFTLRSDLSTLFEDIRLARPTFLNLVPRVSGMIHQAFRTEFLRRTAAGLPPASARARGYEALRSTFLGDRLTAVVIGSAPTAPEVVDFLTGCFEIPVYDGYGSTEAGVVSLDGEICRPMVLDYKLEDVPDLGYRRTDRPWPRGELLVKTRQCVPGYLGNPAATRALYDGEGYQRTGDIVEERGPDQIAWIDRKSNVVKLAQGEYVALWRLENAFGAGSPYLDQVFLCPDRGRSCLLGVIVPAWEAVRERLGEAAPEPGAVRSLLRGELNRVAAAAHLRPFEVPRDFLVEERRWTRENGLLTGVGKPARPRLQRAYGERLEAQFARLEEQRQRELVDLGRGGDPAPLAERVRRAMAAVLGVPGLDPAAGSFTDLGGDSLAALSLATLLEEACGVRVPVAAILDPGRPLADLAREIAAGQGRTAEAPAAFIRVHGADPGRIRGADLALDRFLSAGDLAAAAVVAAQPLPDAVATVLLTGATGFLGRFLALEWLERMARTGGRVVCLVRAADDAAAAARLRSAFRGLDPELEPRFAALDRHLEVLAGDLAAPDLGLAPAVHDRLAREVDLIVHPGALVNHRLGYEQLFGPNVLGTARLIRLALRGRRKRFDFVSSVAVLAGAREPGPVPEAAGVDALQAEWPLAGGYAHGYATSKWACEWLLREANRSFGTPVRVFRGDLIMPHRHYRGQVNVPDLLTRLLVSVITTGLAPASFYGAGQGAGRAHFDGLPVDFVAAALAALSSAHGTDGATYQVSNAHWDDGVSLDTLMDWVQSAGYPLQRIPDHAAWFRAFSVRLRNLPAAERQRSALPLLDSWTGPLQGRGNERADASRFVQAVRQLRPGGEADLPHLDEAYLHKYLADLVALGLVPAPAIS